MPVNRLFDLTRNEPGKEFLMVILENPGVAFSRIGPPAI